MVAKGHARPLRRKAVAADAMAAEAAWYLLRRHWEMAVAGTAAEAAGMAEVAAGPTEAMAGAAHERQGRLLKIQHQPQ